MLLASRALPNVIVMGIGPALPPSLALERKKPNGALSPPRQDSVQPSIGPPLPPTVRGGIPAVSKGTTEANTVQLPPPDTYDEDRTGSFTDTAPRQRKASRIGPPLPPSLSRAAPEKESAPPACRPRTTIGPALPPTAPSSKEPDVVRREAWEAVRAQEGAAGSAATARVRHPGDEGREDWMTVVPEVTGFLGGGGAVVGGNRGFGTGKSVASGGGAVGMDAAKAPVQPGDEALLKHDAGDEDDDVSECDDGPEETDAKRPRVEGEASLLEIHRAKQAGGVSGGANGRLKQFDREKEFSNHKNRDVGHYADMGGGLSAKYGSGSGR